MTDTIQSTITALDETKTDHAYAIATLVRLIRDAYPGEITTDEAKKLEVYVGHIVADVENKTIDTYTGVASLDEARKLAEAGVPDFLDLIDISPE